MTEQNQTYAGRCLAIDTSTSSMTVALLENGKLIGELHSQAERNHSIGLLPHIQQLLSSLGLRPKDVQAVAAGQGPGSYTGVRIGVTVAKTFAWSLGLDLIGVSSLEAMALGGSRADREQQDSRVTGLRWIVPLMDARRGQAFTAVYEDQGTAGGNLLQGWKGLQPDGIRLMETWTEQLLTLAEQAVEAPAQIVFVGETAGFEPQISRLKESFGGSVRALPYSIEAEYIGHLAVTRLAKGEREAVHTFVPNYTQLPEAEVKLLAKAQKGED